MKTVRDNPANLVATLEAHYSPLFEDQITEEELAELEEQGEISRLFTEIAANMNDFGAYAEEHATEEDPSYCINADCIFAYEDFYSAFDAAIEASNVAALKSLDILAI